MIIYLCDCNKILKCDKSSCGTFWNGTLDINYAKLDKDGNPVILEVVERND